MCTTLQRVSITEHVSTVDPVPYIVCNCLSGQVHHVYMYITCPDTGTLLGLLSIAIIFSVCVCCVCMLCVCVSVN